MEDIDVVMGHIAFGCQDEFGQSYIILKKNLMRQFETYSDIKVEYEELAVEVTKDGATAKKWLITKAEIETTTQSPALP
jgi:hypothetical protein